MKKIIQKIKSKVNNSGSSIVLVIVALAFVGILTGALLTAVGSVYRLKLYDYNAKDNFYYLEIAMDEVYAGVGNTTMTCLQDAYTKTIEDMVRYDTSKKEYVTVDKKTAYSSFVNSYKTNLASLSFINSPTSADLDEFLSSFISNSDVEVVPGKASIVKNTDPDSNVIYTIKNVTLTRTGEYKRSQASGEFEQTISADVVIQNPDFMINFDVIDRKASNVYDYAIIADSGVEITQDPSVPVNITGNIYAGSDYYNKSYNADYSGGSTETNRVTGYTTAGSYNYTFTNRAYDKDLNLASDVSSVFDPSAEPEVGNYVSSKLYPSIIQTDSGAKYYNFTMGVVNSQSGNLYNKRLSRQSSITSNYNGSSYNSMYSGLYVEDSKVNILADRVIVPGTIAVINKGELNMYGVNSEGAGTGAATASSIWADNIVLDCDDTVSTSNISHPNILLRGNVHVRDDLELNADYSNFNMLGTYYGFGNGTKKDARKFVRTVNDNFFRYDVNGDGTIDDNDNDSYRSHYNTSSIVINGQNSTLDLTETKSLYIAGRAYIELSKDKNAVGAGVRKSYKYDGTAQDFRTGESVSMKPNQRAYNTQYLGITVDTQHEKTSATDSHKYFDGDLSVNFLNSATSPLYQVLSNGNAFGTSTLPSKLPCVKIITDKGTANEKAYYFIDFEEIWNTIYSRTATTLNLVYPYNGTTNYDAVEIKSADDIAKYYIYYYGLECKNNDSSLRTTLTDLTATVDGFDRRNDNVNLGSNLVNKTVYTEGTAIYDPNFANYEIILNEKKDSTSANANLLRKLTAVSAENNTSSINVADISNDMEKRYAYIKWSLVDYNSADADAQKEYNFVDGLVTEPNAAHNGYLWGESYITPINNYFNFNRIRPNTLTNDYDVTPTNLQLNSGYGVYISNDDVTIHTDSPDGVFQGMVFTKGSVFFDKSVKKFDGMIVSGDKVFVCNIDATETAQMKLTSISANPEVVKSILSECLTMDSSDTRKANANKVLSIMKNYEQAAYEEHTGSTSDGSKTYNIDTLKYTDVVRYDNWMRNVEDK